MNSEQITKESKRFNNNYYYKRFHIIVNVLLFFSIIEFILLLVFLGINFFKMKERTPFFTTNIYNSRVEPLIPLTAPALPANDVVAIADKYATAIYTYNFATYQDSFTNIAKLFSQQGASDFNKMLKDTNLLNTILNNNLFLSATISSPSQVVSEGVYRSSYAWNTKTRIMVTLTDNNQKIVSTFPVDLTMRLIRLPSLQNTETTLLIDSFSALISKT